MRCYDILSVGIGAQWIRQTPAGPFAGAQQGGLVFLYDADSTQLNSTLFYLDEVTITLYKSTDIGITWSAAYIFSTVNISTYGTPRLVGDAENNLYVLNGQGSNDNSVVLFSTNKGASFSTLPFATSSNIVTGLFTLSSFAYGCAAMRYPTVASTAPGGYHRQMVIYGQLGGSTLGGLQTGYGCLSASPARATISPNPTSAVIEVVFPTETLISSELVNNSTVPLPSSGQPILTFHDPAAPITSRWYPTCGQIKRHHII